MTTKTITWPDGSTATLTFNGQGDGTIVVTSDYNNHYESRSTQVTVKTTDGSNLSRTITITQAAKTRVDISSASVVASNQTYSGSTLTPTPTVTLNGETIPSSGYDVEYSDNTNAGTATITVTGKGEYTGTATGTFTIAKANPTYTAPTARTGITYSGSSQYLVTAGSTSHGTIQYSSNGTSWSTTRPSSTNAGSYTTYWRLVGDSNHNDVASTSLSTTIAKASRTLSFADAYVVLAPSGNVTKTATPSAGSGDGSISYSSSNTSYATVNSSGKVTAKTTETSVTITATISGGQNYNDANASYTLYIFATTHDYDYTGTYKSVTLPPGTYKLQCWGAQGGSNAANSSYGITAQAGGKGGYSEGQLTVSQATGIRVYVGGQGSSSAGGFNGGGSTTGHASRESDNEFGYSTMGGGGGATDIRLSSSLYSRIIVAGGGSGGAMSFQRKTTTVTSWDALSVSNYKQWSYSTNYVTEKHIEGWSVGDYIRVKVTVSGAIAIQVQCQDSSFKTLSNTSLTSGSYGYVTVPSGTVYVTIQVFARNAYIAYNSISASSDKQVSSPTTTTDTYGHAGYAGGGVKGDGYDESHKGTQTSAGQPGGSFGNGGDQNASIYCYASGAGGGGWYGGGMDNYTYWEGYFAARSGGGSGWVNTSASAGNRPSGYTGILLDSGYTVDGESSMPGVNGGTKYGQQGNGWAKITRL